MRKLALVLVLAMAMPAMAAVTFSADGTGGKLTISYTADPGDMPRGVALRVSLSDDATAGPDDVEAVMAEFNTNIDFAASNPGNFNIGDGHPLADPAAAGAITEAVSEFSISMGVLDEAGNQAPAPDGGPHELIVINIGASCTATICADTLRGPDSGVVGSVLESNLQDGCIEVEIVGVEPTCDGDFDASGFVTLDDVLLQVNYYVANKDFLGRAPLDGPGYIAGFDTIPGDGYVLLDDVLLMVNYYLANKDFLGRIVCPGPGF